MAKLSPADIVESIRNAGVVGAGGAGFPTHVKAASKAETVICNGAECEPLLHKDKEMLKAYPEKILAGLEMMMRSTGAARGVIALKGKYKELVEQYEKLLKGHVAVRLQALGDFYPAGDEFSLVYDVTGKLIPPGGIPLQVGVVVDNVETLFNVAESPERPVTDTFLTVTGAVKKPATLRVPVGLSIGEVVGLAGGAKAKEFAVLDGGAMMGRVTTDLSEPVKKTSGGLIVLPKDHPLVRKKSAPRSAYSRIGQSVCDQCSFCTQFCPRYLLGYAVEPHRVMRSLGFAGAERRPLSEWALLCCECSLCSLYACPEELDPRNVCVSAKGDLREMKVDWKSARLNTGRSSPAHPMRDFRKVPVARLTRRLGLYDYQAEAHLKEDVGPVGKVRIPLRQHVGAPASPVVSAGQKVSRGQLIAEIPANALGARVHASIAGTVTSVDAAITIEG
ncbi:MAG TPA: 4Fe-4S dicluster domain-containing protein [Elusimicrobiota bacterium]|nr:4Fe-4S dicluster domain-containing protein [Elusimicrobiota bacterium]